jgi:hypothetical protein
MTLHFIIVIVVIIVAAFAAVVVTMDIIQPTISIIVITTAALVLYFLNSSVKVSKNVLYASAFYIYFCSVYGESPYVIWREAMSVYLYR